MRTPRFPSGRIGFDICTTIVAVLFVYGISSAQQPPLPGASKSQLVFGCAGVSTAPWS